MVELPTEFKGLRYLATLHMHIFCSNIVPLPSDIVGLPRLSHLVLLGNATLPDGIGSMKSLCAVQGLDLLDIKDLGELTNLRDIVISKVTVLTDSNIDALITSLGKLHDLRHLSISFVGTATLCHGEIVATGDPMVTAARAREQMQSHETENTRKVDNWRCQRRSPFGPLFMHLYIRVCNQLPTPCRTKCAPPFHCGARHMRRACHGVVRSSDPRPCHDQARRWPCPAPNLT
jgi:hypothetical protein